MNRRTAVGAITGAAVLAAALGLAVLRPVVRAGADGATGNPSAPSSLPARPPRWPATLQLGMAAGLGDVARLAPQQTAGLRYQYLAGGVNTDHGWTTWSPDGRFVAHYVQESVDHGLIPVLTYYMLLHSAPGEGQREPDKLWSNLQNVATMAAYYADLQRFFQQAGSFPDSLVVLHVEPDLWGHLQQRARSGDPTTVAVPVAATGIPELADLPNDLTGFARALGRLRNASAPNVLLGYHLSIWGTGADLVYRRPDDGTVDALATRAARYFLALQGDFDLVFGEFSDRDAAFKEHVYGDRGASWWRPDDYRRHVRFLARFTDLAQRRLVLWQIPLGNTRMRAVNNTWHHYQDNRVEWLLDDGDRGHLAEYARVGVIALLFGGGADGVTCACDAAGDGVTNPEPINGNDGRSLNADDDGGYYWQQAARYYAAGPLPLP